MDMKINSNLINQDKNQFNCQISVTELTDKKAFKFNYYEEKTIICSIKSHIPFHV